MKGRVRVKSSKHARYSHEVIWYQGGKMMRVWVSSAAEARARKEKVEQELEGVLADDAPLSREEWAAVRVVRGSGARLEDVVARWRDWQRQREAEPKQMTVGEMVQRRRAVLAKSGLEMKSQKAIGRMLKTLEKEFRNVPISDFTGAMGVAAIDFGKVSAATLKTRRTLLHGIFEWARGLGMMRENPVAGMKVGQADRRALAEDEDAVSVLSPAEARELLLACVRVAPSLLPYVAIGLLAGLRTAELRRLRWDQVQTERGFIEVRASVSKTRSRRLVDIQPALAFILERVPRGEGLVMPPNVERLLDRTKKAAGYLGAVHWWPKAREGARPWPKNALRDSFSSYHLALFRNAAETAVQDGHSEAVLYKHYRELVTPEAAAEFWQMWLEPGEGWEEWLVLEARQTAERRAHKDAGINYPQERKPRAK